MDDLGLKVRFIDNMSMQALDFYSLGKPEDALMMIHRLQAHINKHFKGPDILREDQKDA